MSCSTEKEILLQNWIIRIPKLISIETLTTFLQNNQQDSKLQMKTLNGNCDCRLYKIIELAISPKLSCLEWKANGR